MPLMHYGCRQTVYQPSPLVCCALRTQRLFWMGLICSVLVAGLFPGAGFPEGHGRIQGVVQRGGQSFAEQRIMLIRFGPNQEVQRTPGQTDAAGRFLFENLETGPGFTYFVGVRYQERLHRSDPILLQSAEPAEVVLEVDEQVAREAEGRGEQSKLHIVNHLIVIVGRDTHLEVREIVRIVNSGSTPGIDKQASAGSASVSFHLPLPQGYSKLGQIQGLAAEHVRIEASGLSYVAPLAPGEHRVMYTYSLPWPTDLTTILVQRTLGTSGLDVLVEEERLITTSDLQFGGRVSIDPHAFAHFRGTNLEAHSRSWLQLMPQRTSASLLPVAAYSLIVGIALLGVVIPLHNSWHGRVQIDKTDIPEPTQRPDLRIAGEHVLRGMARLDDQHDGGMVEEALYQQRRQAYKEQLIKLVTQFQSVQASQDALVEHRGEV